MCLDVSWCDVTTWERVILWWKRSQSDCLDLASIDKMERKAELCEVEWQWEEADRWAGSVFAAYIIGVCHRLIQEYFLCYHSSHQCLRRVWSCIRVTLAVEKGMVKVWWCPRWATAAEQHGLIVRMSENKCSSTPLLLRSMQEWDILMKRSCIEMNKQPGKHCRWYNIHWAWHQSMSWAGDWSTIFISISRVE